MALKKIIVWGVLIFAAIFLVSCSGTEEPVKEIVRPVRYQQVFSTSGEHTRVFSGVSEAAAEARLSFRVGGTIMVIDVKEGDRVEKGAQIAALDSSDAVLQYEKTLSALKKSRVYKETAKSNLKRVRGLYENNNVSLSEYEAAKEKYANANATFNADKRNADLQKKELGYYRLYAPMDGIVSGKTVEINENVTAGQVIMVVNAMDDMEVNVGVPGTFISRVKTGAGVSVRFPSVPGKVFDGVVTEVSYTVDKDSSTYPVTVALSHPTKEVRPGMPADISFSFSIEDGGAALMVPMHAVGEDTAGNYVFTVTATEKGFGIVHRKPVKVGRMTREGFEILEGVEDGELVVTAGIANLTDGLKVRFIK